MLLSKKQTHLLRWGTYETNGSPVPRGEEGTGSARKFREGTDWVGSLLPAKYVCSRASMWHNKLNRGFAPWGWGSKHTWRSTALLTVPLNMSHEGAKLLLYKWNQTRAQTFVQISLGVLEGNWLHFPQTSSVICLSATIRKRYRWWSLELHSSLDQFKYSLANQMSHQKIVFTGYVAFLTLSRLAWQNLRQLPDGSR